LQQRIKRKLDPYNGNANNDLAQNQPDRTQQF